MTAGSGLFAIRFHFRGDLPFLVQAKAWRVTIR